MKSWSLFLTGILLLTLQPTSLPAQGTLTPPGAPAATMRSLDQLDAKLDPRTAINATNTPGNAATVFLINTSGSYYLTGNLTGVSGKSGLQITADDVEIDLRGFTLTGVTGASIGINFASRTRVTVRNGIVRNWPNGGISGVGSASARLSGLTTELNGGNGIFVGESGLVTDCVSRGNTGTAVGIITGARSQVLRCLANSNASNGISVAGESQVIDCIANTNAAIGIGVSGNACRVSGCTAISNVTGINHGSSGGIIERCVVRANSGTGISVGGDGLVIHCTAVANADGIVCNGSSQIVYNTCNTNTNAGAGAGIRISAFRARVEGNVCALNDLGIVTTNGPNLVIRNHCNSNATNFSLVGTGAGPVVTEANVATNTNPHANFDF